MTNEPMKYDVVIIGCGPAGLSAAIKIKQLDQTHGTNTSICIVEKGSEVGAHIVSGAVLETRALDELFPNWKNMDSPIRTKASIDKFKILNSKGSINVPSWILPKVMNNSENYIISLGNLCRWLSKEAEKLGVEIYPGFSASKIIYDANGKVNGIQTGHSGISKNNEHTPRYEPGIKLIANQTIFAEGCRGHLGKELISKYKLDNNKLNQTYGIGLKELWEIDPDKHKEGLVLHTVGWPLKSDVYGGSFVYHFEENLVSLGFVLGLDYSNPYIDPYEEFQLFKTHNLITKMLEGGRRIAYGARALNEGGLQSLPKMSFPGGLLIGCDAGTLNMPKIKGTHTAMKSGIVAAEVCHEALKNKSITSNNELKSFDNAFKKSWAYNELYKARNVRPSFHYGLLIGMIYTAVDQHLFRGNAPWTFMHKNTDHESLKPLSKFRPKKYPKHDGKITFDKLTNLSFSGTNHEEDQPCHLKLKNLSTPIDINYKQYGSPETLYCPAGVYEIVKNEKGDPKLQINFQNCLHCKTCDIKDPTQNISWQTPEGGNGPRYPNM